MTNKQKAEEICKRHIFDSNHFDCCMEIADWKDKQFSMIIEKIIELFDKYPSNAVFSKNNVVEMLKTLKKAMEEE